MQFLDLYSYENNRAHYLFFLCQANGIDVRSIVEIGSWMGKTASDLRRLFPGSHLYLIDPWKPSASYLEKGRPPCLHPEEFEKAYQHVRALFEGDPLTTILRKTSLQGAKKIPQGIDLAFIDGDHSYEQVKQDILTWKKKIRHGGLLAGHDYNADFPDVIRAVNETLANRFVVGRGSVWATII